MEAGAGFAFVVAGERAGRYLIQRVALWAWERGLKEYKFRITRANDVVKLDSVHLVR